MIKVKGALMFPVLTNTQLANKKARDADAKRGGTLLFKPDDPQLAGLKQTVEQAAADKWPNGAGKLSWCLDLYENKFDSATSYFDPKLMGHYVLAFSDPQGAFSPEKHLVDESLSPVMDPSDIFPGAVVWIAANVSAFENPKKKGVGCYVNGVMVTKEEPPFGRFDNAPSIEQMFGGMGAAPAPMPAPMPVPPAPAPQPPAAPAPTPVPAPPPAPTDYMMTAAAAGVTRQQYHDQGWTDEQLIQQGLMQKMSFA